MTSYDQRFFRKFTFTQNQLEQYRRSARRDLEIAQSTCISEVRYKFSYDALLKIAMYQLAIRGYRVRSIAGHHLRLIEALSDLLQTEELYPIANEMRQKRNRGLYEGQELITEKDSLFYLEFVKDIGSKVLKL